MAIAYVSPAVTTSAPPTYDGACVAASLEAHKKNGSQTGGEIRPTSVPSRVRMTMSPWVQRLGVGPGEVTGVKPTLAELTAGPHLASEPAERARRQGTLQQAEALFEPLPFERAAARSYGLVVAAVAAAGRSHRRRVADLLIASVAVANGLPLYTRNAADFEGLETLLTVTRV